MPKSLMLTLFAPVLAFAVETVVSPKGTLAVSVGDDFSWSVSRKGETVLEPSRLGLAFQGQAPFGASRLVRLAERKIDATWKTRLYKKETVRDCANELELEWRETAAPNRRLGLVVRAYDGAIAFRYRIPAQPGFEQFTLVKEETSWRFPDSPLAWVTAYGGYRTSQEEGFYRRALRTLGSSLAGSPLIVEIAGGYAALCEADLTNWAGLFFKVPPDGQQPGFATDVVADLAPIPGCPGELVIAQAPCNTPWRVMVFGDDADDLLDNNDVILNLNPPPEGGDEAFAWVKPGATSWDWWVDSNNALSTERTLQLIDFAAEMGWPYHTIDGGWYGFARRPNHGPGVKIFPRADFDLDRILAHAREKGVGIFVWCYWSALEDNDPEQVFADFERRGIKGVKVDFMDRQDQWMVRWYEKICRLAARHHLMVNFHGAYKPTGMNRTWPNQITREGIRGNEMMKFNAVVTPVHVATLPFTRYLLGPADFTPGSFANVHAREFVSQSARGHRYADARDTRPIWAEEIGTRAHALALCFAYDSPLMTFCDAPERYRGAAGIDALRNPPTTWKATLPLAGAIGSHYAVAREAFDGRIYLAAFTVRAKTLELPLFFLNPGAWEATFYTDDPVRTPRDAKALAVSTRRVTQNDHLTLALADEGGALVIFRPVPALR